MGGKGAKKKKSLTNTHTCGAYSNPKRGFCFSWVLFKVEQGLMKVNHNSGEPASSAYNCPLLLICPYNAEP